MSLTLQTIGATAFRVGIGLTIAAHGTQKLLGWFGGGGIAGTGGYFESVGFLPGKPHAIAAGANELGGGALLALGLATPAAGAAVASNMIVASSTHVDNGFFVTNGGLEYPAVLGAIGASYAATGAGPLSLDAVLGSTLDRPWMRVAALAAIVPSAAVVIARRTAALKRGAGGTGTHADEDAAATAPGSAT